MPDRPSLEEFYDEYERVEKGFDAALDVSLEPRGSESLMELVADLGLPNGALAVDAGCGQGLQAVELAERFGFVVIGVDPVERHVELANALRTDAQVRFELGRVEALPVADASTNLVWCRDVLVHVEDLDAAYREFARVLVPGGHAVVYQSCLAGDRLEAREGAWLWDAMGVVPANADPARTDAAIAASGLTLDTALDVSIEWAEASEERNAVASRRLLHAGRLLRAPERYIEEFGQAAYDIMLADCFWHVFRLIGKLDEHVYVLSKP